MIQININFRPEVDLTVTLRDGPLTGHAPGSVGDGYWAYPLAVLSEAINKIKFPVSIRDPFIDLEKLPAEKRIEPN